MNWMDFALNFLHEFWQCMATFSGEIFDQKAWSMGGIVRGDFGTRFLENIGKILG